MTDNYDQLALGWVRKEINHTLEQARQGLENFIENDQDVTQIQFCINCLHQVQGTMQMLGFDGAARLALEMETLAQKFSSKSVEIKDASFEVLMRAMLQMPGYLERVEEGQKDIPKVLMPLINELRAASGLAPAKDNEFFSADVTQVQAPKPNEAITENEKKNSFQDNCKKLQAHFRKGLNGIKSAKNIKESLARMHKVLLKLEAFSEGGAIGKLWWIADGFIFSIAEKGLYKDQEIQDLLGAIEKHIDPLVKRGKAALQEDVPEALLSKLLYFVANAESKNARVVQIKKELSLDNTAAQDKEIEEQQKQLTRPDSSAMASVVEAIGEEIASVKDQLDLFVRAQAKDPAQLQQLSDSLVRIADTLEILELPIPRDVIRKQTKTLQKNIDLEKLPDDSSIMDIAGALLFVDANLSNINFEVDDEESEESLLEKGEQQSKMAQVDEATLALVGVARKNLQLAKDGLIDYIASNYDSTELDKVPGLLAEVFGAMKIVQFDEAAEILMVAERFVSESLLETRRTPMEDHLDALADIVTSVDYYLEGTEEGNNKTIISILSSAKPSQDVLIKVLESEPELAEVTSIEENNSSESDSNEEGQINQTDDSSERVASESPGTESKENSSGITADQADKDISKQNTSNIISINQSSANKVIDESLIDDEVLEIFLEEAEEEIEVIEQTLPNWISDTKNKDALSTIRRSFHTLKGSGRLVGAVAIGELSWAVENMLNKVIEDTIPAENPVLGVLNNTLTKLPFLVKEFADKAEHVGDDVKELIARAEHIAKGLNLSDFDFVSSDDLEAEELTGNIADQNEITADHIPVLSDELDSGEADEPIDPILLEIFVNEAQVHLNSMRKFIASAANQSSIAVTDDLIRALHTLKGSAHMAKVDAIAKLSGPLEKVARLTKASNKRFDQNTIEVFTSCNDFLEDTVSKLKESLPVDGNILDSLLHKIQQLGHVSDGEESSPDSAHQKDHQLMSIFLTEGADVVQEINQCLSDLEQSSDYSNIAPKIANEFSAFVKACEMIGLHDIQHFAAVCEMVSKVNPVDSEDKTEYLRLLSSGSEQLAEMLNSQISEEDISVPAALIEEMQSWASDISKGSAPSDMDQELVELFVEEADELLETIQDLMPRWQDHLNSEDLTKELRRIYHTFKGSSRMAGAMNIGELGFAIEELFNAAIDHGRKLESADFAVVKSSNRTLAEMVDVLRNFNWPDSANEDINRLKQLLDPNFIPEANDTSLESNLIPDETALTDEDAPTASLDIPDETSGSEPNIIDSEVMGEAPEESLTKSDAETEEVEEETIIVKDEVAEISESDEVVRTEDTISPAAPLVSIGNVYQINLDEDGLEVLEIFLEEADELLISLDESLHIWSEDNSNTAAIDTMLRTLHTLKGGARLADLVVLGDLTHEMETYFEKINDGTANLSEANTQHIVEGYDVIESLVTEIRDENQMTMPIEYIESLKKIIAGEDIQDSVKDNTKAAKSKKKAKPRAEAQKSEEKSAEIVSFEDRKQKQEEKRQPTTAVDTVRVNSNQLEGLVNLAGETSIFRSRLEQQMTVLRYNLDEMSSTVERLKDQLRNLDIETEAQISYRREISGGTEYDDFDPLEMDRYTRQQELTRGLGESAVDLMNLKETLDSLTSDSETLLLQQGRVNTEMQESLMQTRMTPFESLVPRLRRMVRQIGTELGKTIELSISADGEMDRSVLERMIAPLEHMLRNAMDHGIESPSQRKKNKKPETGKISISLYREGSEVFIKIKDDGRGLDLEAIREKAMERGLITEDTELTPNELRQLILEAGFSTAEKVTQISGRGVGMDVVNSEIKQMGGVIEIDSQVGLGSTFTVRLPFTVSVNHALMVQIGDEIYAIPLSNIEGIVRVSPFELEEYYSNEESKFGYAGIDYSMYYLGEMLEHQSKAKLEGVSQPLPVLLLHGADHPTALQVDDLLGSREIVVKSIGSQLSSVSGLSGATIQGDGRVVLILDMPALIRRVDAQISESPILTETIQQDRIPRVMVVDDSITVRKVTTRLLERHDFEVVTAKDGVDAVTVLADAVPDVMLLDIEMPRMDGFELATIIRHDERLKDIPIIMITSRTGEKHRERAESIGVNRYMGKPYNEVDLLETINSLLAKDS